MKEHEDVGRNELGQDHVGWGTLSLVGRLYVSVTWQSVNRIFVEENVQDQWKILTITGNLSAGACVLR